MNISFNHSYDRYLHRDIETTLEYNHPSDEDAYRYLQQQGEIDYTNMSPESKAQLLTNKFLKGEIDKNTFNVMLELLKPDVQKAKGTEIDGYV